MEIPAEYGSAIETETPEVCVTSEEARVEGWGRSALWKLLAFILLNGVVFNLGLIAFDRYVEPGTQNVKERSTLKATSLFFVRFQGQDSLNTMVPAIRVLLPDPKTPVYETVFFADHTKFQYPLTSLLPYYALQRMGVSENQLFSITKVATWISTWITLLLAIAIALRFLPRDEQDRRDRPGTILTVFAVGFGGLVFYPVIRCFCAGQIQTILTTGFTLAIYCWLSRRERVAGAIMGLMMLVKPQYCVFLLWATLRKKFGAVTAALGCVLLGGVISCLVFGLRNNLDYLRVLQDISRHGEGYFPNQSMNGLMNRLLQNGNNMNWVDSSFAPYNPIVYYTTLLTSAIILGFGLFWRWDRSRRGGVLDFACITLASTMASPIAWEHHYAILLPIFVLIWFSGCLRKNTPWETVTLAAAYVLASNSIIPLAAMGWVPALNILQSYLFFGAVLVLIVLLRVGARPAKSPRDLMGSVAL